MEALNLAEHEMREEKIQSDEILAREKIIQANLGALPWTTPTPTT